MKKITTNAPTPENNSPATNATKHPAEIENARLRLALAEERTKTEALARRVIRLGEDLDAANKAEDDRAESDMFAIVNGHFDRRIAEAVAEEIRIRSHKAATIAKNRNSIRKQKAADSCKRNAVTMVLASIVGFTSVILGITGFVNPILGASIVGLCLIAFGWTTSACIHQLRVVEE